MVESFRGTLDGFPVIFPKSYFQQLLCRKLVSEEPHRKPYLKNNQISYGCFENLGNLPVREGYVIEFLLSKLQACKLQPSAFRVVKILETYIVKIHFMRI